MKSNLLSLTAILVAGTLVLSGCCNNDTHSEAKEFCLSNGGTYSVVTSADEEYGECSFPSGIGCRDDILFTGCDFVADTSNIDTEEKRLAGCEESAKGWVEDFENGENISINWEDESEGGASFVRNGIISYTKEGANWEIDVECVADFVDGSISTSYGEAVSEVPSSYVKTELTNEDIDHVEEILPPLSFDFETWNMEDETMVESGHYDYPEDVENGYVFIPEHATMVSREVVSSGIEDGMIYTLTNVTLQDGTVISVLYIHDPETLFVRAITVENGKYTTYYRNFLYNADVE